MEIKGNYIKTKNLHTNREIIVDLSKIDYFDFVINPVDPTQSYTQLWIFDHWIKIPDAYLLIMKHFGFFKEPVDN
ncbi:hypothetical protein ES705_25244 [subsurface metagenome]